MTWNSKFYIIILLMVSVWGQNPVAAQKSKVEGLSDSTELVNTRIESITFQSKPRVAMPEPDLTPPAANLSYEPKIMDFKPKIATPELKVKMLDKPVWKKLENNFVKAGFGLYLTPLLKVGIYSGRDLRKDWGIEFDHFSSFGGHVKDATFGDNTLRLQGRYLAGSGITYYTKLSFRNFGYNAFGMKREGVPDMDDKTWNELISRNYHQLNLLFGFKKRAEGMEKISYDAPVRIQHYADRLNNSEFFFSLLPEASYKLQDSMNIRLKSELTFGSVGQPVYNGGEARTAHFLDLTPQFIYRKGIFNVAAGFRVNAVNDTLQTRFGIYPALRADLHVMPKFFTLYAGLDGQSRFNRRYDLSAVNPFMSGLAYLRPTYEKLRIFGGVKGCFENLSYDIQIYYRSSEDELMFTASAKDTVIENQRVSARQFAAVYEKEFSETGGTVQLGYDIEKKMKLGLKADYAIFNVPNVGYFYHRPNLNMKLWGNYTINKKLNIGGGVNCIGNRVAGKDFAGKPEELSGFFDLNVESHYQISKRVRIFAEANNLLNQSFYRWQFYPERRLDFRAGIWFTF